jgi:hypothetical protein
MMKNKLELYLLDGCNKCSRIKYALLADEIEYDAIDCTNSDNKKCDTLEDKIDCGKYPMAVVKRNGITTIIHFCDTKASSNTKISVDSEDKFINEIKKAYI